MKYNILSTYDRIEARLDGLIWNLLPGAYKFNWDYSSGNPLTEKPRIIRNSQK